MWLAMQKGARRTFEVFEHQTIWPAPDGSDVELSIITESKLEQEVVLVTERAQRLRYNILSTSATMGVGDDSPAPWLPPDSLKGLEFDIMLGEKGALVVPGEHDALPNRHAKWFDRVAENVRSAWPVPPAALEVGSTWQSMPAAPGGLPPGAVSAQIRVENLVLAIEDTTADIRVRFGVRVTFDHSGAAQAQRGEGRGELVAKLDQARGLCRATRKGRMELVRPQTRNQLLRSKMRVTAL